MRILNLPEIVDGIPQTGAAMTAVNEEQMGMISSLIYRKFGIYIGRDKFPRLILKLERMIGQEDSRGTEELCTRLAAGDTACMNRLVCCVTTCHTFFFREPEHFSDLVADIRRNRRSGSLIWCAACSTGEEPYSIAMTLLDEGIRDFHIIASDVNRDVLAEFNHGIYHENRFIQTPPAVRQRYFTPAGDGYYRIDRSLRDFISIKNLNLMDPVHFPELFDYAFCRNVFIYFNEESRARAVGNITSNLKKDGLLFIGHAEVLLSQPDNLKKAGSSVYCRL
jgi:chemotaxis protein methyltransferase CheR